jgi:MFS-type transporter involved in bile tolerance (Atg22 family)
LLKWGGQQTSINSFILDTGGILFAVQLVVLLLIGPYADYGTWRPWILIFWTVVGCATSFAFFGLTSPDKWALASGFYVAANLAVNITGAFYQAPFPALVRDLPKMAESERQVIQGLKSPEEHATLDMLERSKLSNISLMFSAIGSMLCILITLGICYAMGTSTVEENTKVYSVIIGFFGVVWVISSIPWFVVEQHRPGQRLPDNTSWLTVGPKQVWEAAKNLPRLKQTFLYLAGYFLIADVYNTSGAVVNILQNEAISFDSITFCGLFALVYGLEFIDIMVNNYIQQRFSIRPKWMFFAAACGVVFTNLWGKFIRTQSSKPPCTPLRSY